MNRTHEQTREEEEQQPVPVTGSLSSIHRFNRLLSTSRQFIWTRTRTRTRNRTRCSNRGRCNFLLTSSLRRFVFDPR
ncbi:hypothetical protein F2P81_017995 [Scophthalmus maximus]|uniref:Uncharacterized protein n=1 Tax=Scophthalmus maximus TaxID=52904 RepID=A0A6A4SB32_SCOMX|nr:hypothetical protein F2P81_017995 [Scophthalmus maximus]